MSASVMTTWDALDEQERRAIRWLQDSPASPYFRQPLRKIMRDWLSLLGETEDE